MYGKVKSCKVHNYKEEYDTLTRKLNSVTALEMLKQQQAVERGVIVTSAATYQVIYVIKLHMTFCYQIDTANLPQINNIPTFQVGANKQGGYRMVTRHYRKH